MLEGEGQTTFWVENEVGPEVTIEGISEAAPEHLEMEVRAPLEGPPKTEALAPPPTIAAIELDLSDDRLLRRKPGRAYISPRTGSQ